MKSVSHPEELADKLGSIVTTRSNEHFSYSGEMGDFTSQVEHFGDFTAMRHDYKSKARSLSIPVTSEVPTIQMMFSVKGQSVYSDKFNPYVLSSLRHSLNYFNSFDCRNLLMEGSKQNDVVFALSENFYRDIVSESYEETGNKLFQRIHRKSEFNTINQHLPVDAGIQGLLQNILNCPYSGNVKTLFMREHLRALLLIQFFHFNHRTGAKPLPVNNKITARDRETIIAIKEYLDENFLDTTSLLTLSRRFGINEFKLKHGFKTVFNTSPIKYLQQRRLELSIALLKDTGKSISEISEEIGYSHPNNFSLAFRKNFGYSPQTYRDEAVAMN